MCLSLDTDPVLLKMNALGTRTRGQEVTSSLDRHSPRILVVLEYQNYLKSLTVVPESLLWHQNCEKSFGFAVQFHIGFKIIPSATM